jgi:uncharacterized lipoprotein YddW (UPF0748 family)
MSNIRSASACARLHCISAVLLACLLSVQVFAAEPIEFLSKSTQSASADKVEPQAADKAARASYALSVAQAIPVRSVEGRCIWLDRGTIAAAANRAGMAHLFDRLKDAGINTVYFEANNAGFAMFRSNLEPRNPLVTDSFDPLAVAIEEAHKRGMELHAWMWVFRVGDSLPPPGQNALAQNINDWTLRTAGGSPLTPIEGERWLSPGNPDARKFVKDLMVEVAQNYAVDGIQMDYIRFPFQKPGNEMGYDSATKARFEADTGLHLSNASKGTWNAWKTSQVSMFVKEASAAVKSVNPKLRITAAVFPIQRQQRLFIIQQDWETWSANGWIDILTPMTYKANTAEFEAAAGYVLRSAGNKVTVYPALAISRFDSAGFAEQLAAAQRLGAPGIIIFAAAHLDDEKVAVAKNGPWRKPAIPAHAAIGVANGK